MPNHSYANDKVISNSTNQNRTKFGTNTISVLAFITIMVCHVAPSCYLMVLLLTSHIYALAFNK